MNWYISRHLSRHFEIFLFQVDAIRSQFPGQLFVQGQRLWLKFCEMTLSCTIVKVIRETDDDKAVKLCEATCPMQLIPSAKGTVIRIINTHPFFRVDMTEAPPYPHKYGKKAYDFS
jgi:hypothetical protein